MEHDAVLEVIAAWPTPAELKRAGKARIDARLKKHGCRRHATWASQIVSALEHQSVTVAGTDAAATVLPHLARQLIAPRAQRADVAAQAGDPGGWPTLMRQAPTTPCPGSGVPAATVLAGRDPGQGPPGTGAQLASYAGLTPVTRRSGSSIRGKARLPRRQQEAQARHVPLRLRLTALRPRLPGLLPAQTPAGETSQPGRPRPGPPPHPDPARHDPQPHPQHPPTINTATRSRLTHHPRAPPGEGGCVGCCWVIVVS